MANRILNGEYSGFFFGGGKQDQYTKVFYRRNKTGKRSRSAILQAILKQFASGKLMIAGTSAGAVVQSSDVMIVRGKSNRGIVEGAREGCEYDRSTLQYISGGGFGLFEYGIIDSHFSERGREGRSIRLASDTGTNMIFGIDEATALVVTQAHSPIARMKVIGQNGVQIFDLSKVVTKINDQRLWSIKMLNLHI